MTKKPVPLWNDGKDHVIGYMCLTDFECELGCASDGNPVYPSIRSCKEQRPCVEQCGIVEVKVEGLRIVQAPMPAEKW